MECATEDALLRLSEGTLADEARSATIAHVEACEACRTLLAELARDGAPPPLARGSMVGRYVVLDVLGAGAMGAVYAAFDGELDRKVALKMLRADVATEAREALRTRLVREAKALARLAHPNVVAVHDAGTHEGEVFLAMELVGGKTLTAWLRDAPRPWRTIVRVLRQAGEGLAAAHAAGIVHRDFKPDNVLVGDDGRVRVSDFGLARDGEDGVPEADEPRARARNATRTRTGALAGTPAYMAPEQADGRPATPRSDVYAFAVSLHEALYGARPGEADARNAGVPASVRRVVARGLAASADARWPSLRAMLDALDRATRPPRAAWMEAGIVAALAVGVAVFAAPRGVRVEPCAGAETSFDAAWGPERRAAVRAALAGAGTEAPLAELERTLDAYRRSFVAMHREACVATRVRGEQSESMLDRRMACLDDRRRRAESLTRALAAAGADALPRAVEAAQTLPDVGYCGNLAALGASGAPAVAPELRNDLAKLEDELADVLTAMRLLSASPIDALTARAELAIARARKLGDLRVLARALYVRGLVEGLWRASSRPFLHEAAALATEARDDELLADAWIALLEQSARASTTDETKWYARHAEAAIQRLGGDDDREAQRLIALAVGYEKFLSDPDEAMRLLDRARAKLLAVHGPDDFRLARIDDSVGNLHFARCEFEKAIPHYEHGHALRSKLFGPKSVLAGIARHNRAEALVELGRVDEGLGELRAVLADVPQIGHVKDRVAHALRRKGDFAAALVFDEEECAAAPEDRARMWCLLGAGADLLGLGRAADARKRLESAFAIDGPLPAPDRAELRLLLARALLTTGGDPARAARLLGEARALVLPWSTYGCSYAARLHDIDAEMARAATK